MSTGDVCGQNRVKVFGRGRAQNELAWCAPEISCASHRSRDARERSLRARRRRDRGSVVDADAAEARELHGGMAQIEACDQAENVDLDALDPTQLDTEETPKRGFDACAAVGQPDIGIGAEVLAHGV